MGDRLSAGKRAANLGEAALKRGGARSRELAEVVACNQGTHTYLVRTHGGAPIPDVPRKRSDPRDFAMLPLGTTVIISWDLGFPYIDGCIDMPGLPQTALQAPTITGIDGIGADNPLQPTDGNNNYAPPTAPTDLTQGDWAKIGPLGQHVAVLEGGIASLGTPNALVRSLGLIGLLQTIAKGIQTVTDFGEWKVVNDQGNVSFVLRAGSSQTTQTGLDEDHFTIRLDLGASGNLFNFQITTPEGKTLFKLFAGADGRVQIYGDAGVDISSGPNGDKEQRTDALGAHTTNIGADKTTTIGGVHAMTVGKSSTRNITTDQQVVVGNDDTLLVNKDQTISVGGNRTDVVAGGTAQDAKPGNVAVSMKVLNGGYMIDIGNPADGANISAQAGYSLKTALGDISFDAGMGMKLHAKQTVDVDGQLIKLGGSHPSPLFDDYLRDEAQAWIQLLAVLQAGTAGGPTAQQLTGLPAVAAQLQQFAQKLAQGIPYESRKVSNG